VGLVIRFEHLQVRLLERLRSIVREGEHSERGLAYVTGLSQPHLHNVLKGVRPLTSEVADQVMRALGVDLLDLLKPEEMGSYLADLEQERLDPTRLIPLLRGKLAPGEPPLFPYRLESQLRVPGKDLMGINSPAALRSGHDPDMVPFLREGDLLLADLRPDPSELIGPDQLYWVSWNGLCGARWVRVGSGCLYLIPFSGWNCPGSWSRVDSKGGAGTVILATLHILHEVGPGHAERFTPRAASR
jgi:transcriptional regulator with XRE-family HTH domain